MPGGRFNPRPAHARGATRRGRLRSGLIVCFNPRPAHARGATRAVGAPGRQGRVSIRAPRTRAGRPGYTVTQIDDILFQSAPRARARGDKDRHGLRAAPRGFNPRPAHARGATLEGRGLQPLLGGFNPRPAHARGATTPTAFCPRSSVVSIRAPRTRAGRQIDVWTSRRSSAFQSAPRARARGDAAGDEDHRGAGEVSIRAPRTRAGRRRRPALHGACSIVSIRAPRTRAGRPSPPTPRTRAGRLVRCVAPNKYDSFNPRPAHARGATLAHPRHQRHRHCFNPRPAHARGATHGFWHRCQLRQSFNPRPAHARGATQ